MVRGPLKAGFRFPTVRRCYHILQRPGVPNANVHVLRRSPRLARGLCGGADGCEHLQPEREGDGMRWSTGLRSGSCASLKDAARAVTTLPRCGPDVELAGLSLYAQPDHSEGRRPQWKSRRLGRGRRASLPNLHLIALQRLVNVRHPDDTLGRMEVANAVNALGGNVKVIVASLGATCGTEKMRMLARRA